MINHTTTALPRHQHDFTDEAFLAEFTGGQIDLSGDDMESARLKVVEHFRDRLKPRWVFDLRSETAPSEEMFHLWPPKVMGDTAQIIERAALAGENRLTMTEGMVLDFGPGLDWVTPETRSLIVPGNIFKCSHWLRDVAFAWAITRDPRHAETWGRLMERWLRDFPMMLDDDFTGEKMIFNQHYGEKSMPTGQRLYNWLSCLYTGIPFAPEVPTETAFQFIKALWYNGAVYQHFEASPFQQHNHHIMRTVNIPACMAIMFPETPRFRGLMAMARDRLSQHVRKSFLTDDGYAERSSSYAQVTVAMFMAPMALARINGIELADADALDQLHRAGDFIASLILPTGTLPPCGDGGSNPVVTAASLYVTVLATGSSTAAGALAATPLASIIPSALRLKDPVKEPPKHCRYPHWGMGVLRTGWGPEESALTMSIPDGRNTNHSHAHDDALACSLILRGREIIAVPADELYLYVNSAEWWDTPHHNYLYSSLGKNVVLPLGRPRVDPEKEHAAFCLDTPPVTSVLTSDEECATLRAETTVNGVRWEREAALDKDVGTVRDRLTRPDDCDREVAHILQWHFQYGVEVEQTDDGVIADDGVIRVRVRLSTDSPLSKTLVRNEEWLKPNTGRADQPAPWLLSVSFGEGATESTITTQFTIEG